MLLKMVTNLNLNTLYFTSIDEKFKELIDAFLENDCRTQYRTIDRIFPFVD